jgi:hypothetical protein
MICAWTTFIFASICSPVGPKPTNSPSYFDIEPGSHLGHKFMRCVPSIRTKATIKIGVESPIIKYRRSQDDTHTRDVDEGGVNDEKRINHS